eukprot:scaffold482_cov247-Pinguiococcus_pyrenoidosus.AAC.7
MLIELLLKLLVAVVDAQLLEAVHFEDLEAKDVEDADDLVPGILHALQRASARAFHHAAVDALDEVIEEVAIDGRGQRVSRVARLAGVELDHGRLGPDRERSHAEPLAELRFGNAKELCRAGERLVAIRDPAPLGAGDAMIREGQVAEVHDRRAGLGDLLPLLRGYSEVLHSLDVQEVVSAVVNALDARAVAPREAPEVLRRRETEVSEVRHLDLLVRVRPASVAPRPPVCAVAASALSEGDVVRGRAELVEDVVGPFVRSRSHDARLLQQVVDDVAADDLAAGAEIELHELPEARRVVVPRGLGVPEGLQDGVAGEDLLLDAGRGARHFAQVVQALLGALRLAGARLAADEDGLVDAEVQQAGVGRGGDAVDVRRQIVVRHLHVLLHDERRVERQQLERVDRHEDIPDASVDVILEVPLPQRVHHRGLANVLQLHQVVGHLLQAGQMGDLLPHIVALHHQKLPLQSGGLQAASSQLAAQLSRHEGLIRVLHPEVLAVRGLGSPRRSRRGPRDVARALMAPIGPTVRGREALPHGASGTRGQARVARGVNDLGGTFPFEGCKRATPPISLLKTISGDELEFVETREADCIFGMICMLYPGDSGAPSQRWQLLGPITSRGFDTAS